MTPLPWYVVWWRPQRGMRRRNRQMGWYRTAEWNSGCFCGIINSPNFKPVFYWNQLPDMQYYCWLLIPEPSKYTSELRRRTLWWEGFRQHADVLRLKGAFEKGQADAWEGIPGSREVGGGGRGEKKWGEDKDRSRGYVMPLMLKMREERKKWPSHAQLAINLIWKGACKLSHKEQMFFLKTLNIFKALYLLSFGIIKAQIKL